MVSQGLFPDLLGQRSQKLDSPTLSSLSSRSGTPSVPRAQPVSLPPSLCVQDFQKSRTQNSCDYTSSLLFALITDHTLWSVRVLSPLLKSKDYSFWTPRSPRLVSAQMSGPKNCWWGVRTGKVLKRPRVCAGLLERKGSPESFSAKATWIFRK